MSDRLTDAAQRAVHLAGQEAQYYKHARIEAEHLLLGLSGEHDGIAWTALRNQGTDFRKVRRTIEKVTISGSDVVGGAYPSSRTTAIMVHAQMEAGAEHDVGTGHLLLALLREDDGIAGRVLRSVGVDLDKLRREVVELVNTGPHEARSRVALDELPEQAPQAVKDLHERIVQLNQEKNTAVERCDFEHAARLRDQGHDLKRERDDLLRRWREQEKD